jgi:hypothetical protein
MSTAGRLAALVAKPPEESELPAAPAPSVLCPRCRSALPAAAAFCSRCGEPQSAVARAEAQDWHWCEIVWWRGYVKSQFVAYVRDPAGADVRLYTSRMFRWGRKQAPSQLKHRVADAYHELVAELRQDGWEEAGRGEPWYAARFRRDSRDVWPAFPGAKLRNQTSTPETTEPR